MSLFLTLVYFFLYLGPLCFTAAAAPPPPQFVPPKLPEEDPFYTPPPGFELQPPGTILRYRPVPGGITLDNKYEIKPKAAWQLLYRTQNSIGEPGATVTTVLIPSKPNKKKLFTFFFFSDSPCTACNPSIVLQRGARKDAEFTQSQTAIIIAALSKNWIVQVPDDNGPRASFAAGLQFAYAALDSIRAVLKSGNITDVPADAAVTMYGYSGGGVTTAWATELQPQYAPELKIAGAALGGLTPNLSEALQLYNKGARASYIPGAFLGQSHDYKNLSKWLDDNLIPSLASEFRSPERQCFNSNTMFSGKDIGMYFKRGFASLVYDDVPNSVMREAGTMGRRDTPKIPWYLYETKWDDISPVELTDGLVAKYCKQGASITYEKNSLVNLTHSQESVWGLGGTLVWLGDRLDGKPVAQGCSEVKMSKESMSAWLTGKNFASIFDILWAWAGLPI